MGIAAEFLDEYMRVYGEAPVQGKLKGPPFAAVQTWKAFKGGEKFFSNHFVLKVLTLAASSQPPLNPQPFSDLITRLTTHLHQLFEEMPYKTLFDNNDTMFDIEGGMGAEKRGKF